MKKFDRKHTISWERGLTPVSLHCVTTICWNWSIWLWKRSFCEAKKFCNDSMELPISTSMKSSLETSIVDNEDWSSFAAMSCSSTHSNRIECQFTCALSPSLSPLFLSLWLPIGKEWGTNRVRVWFGADFGERKSEYFGGLDERELGHVRVPAQFQQFITMKVYVI